MSTCSRAPARVARRDARGGGHRRRLRAPGQALPEPLGGRPRDHRHPWSGPLFFGLRKTGKRRMNRPEVKRKVRCAVYTRKSSEEGLDQEFNCLDAQRAAGEAYVASQSAEGWLLVPDRYDDGGISGATLERPALKRLLADVEAGRIDSWSSTRSTGSSARLPTLPSWWKSSSATVSLRLRHPALLYHDLDGQVDAQRPVQLRPIRARGRWRERSGTSSPPPAQGDLDGRPSRRSAMTSGPQAGGEPGRGRAGRA